MTEIACVFVAIQQSDAFIDQSYREIPMLSGNNYMQNIHQMDKARSQRNTQAEVGRIDMHGKQGLLALSQFPRR
jgi:hypothetical protein